MTEGASQQSTVMQNNGTCDANKNILGRVRIGGYHMVKSSIHNLVHDYSPAVAQVHLS